MTNSKKNPGPGFQNIPGAELVQQGMKDLQDGKVTAESLLLQIASPRLEALGISLPHQHKPQAQPYEHQLYALLEARLGRGAHSQYNALIRRIVSFAHALER